jgi:GAF domain-containing protein
VVDVTTLHEDLARVVLVGRDVADVLADLTTVARRALPGSEATSITLIRGDKPFTAAHDGQMALDADELQYVRDYGPCVDAGRSGEIFVVRDMATEDRWPDYCRHVADQGVRSSLSLPLPFQAATIGALNNYSTRPDAFGEDDVVIGEEVASWVALAVANASAAATAADETVNMREAMITRGGIEQAKGILMERYKVTADQAFAILSTASQRSGTKLRDVAGELVRTGTIAGSL